MGSLALATEAPSASLSLAQGVSDNHIDKAPDLVAKYSIDPSWGHVAVAGLGRYLTNNDGVAHGAHSSTLVGGVMAGLGVKTIGKDMFLFQTVDGNGVGSYLEQGQGFSAVLLNGAIKPVNIWGGTAGYNHFWTDSLRSTVAYGYGHFSTPMGDTKQPIKDLSSLHVNLIWSPVTDMDVGVEYIWGRVEQSVATQDSATGSWASSGNASRIQGSVKYAF
jgi:hypothetical protein